MRVDTGMCLKPAQMISGDTGIVKHILFCSVKCPQDLNFRKVSVRSFADMLLEEYAPASLFRLSERIYHAFKIRYFNERGTIGETTSGAKGKLTMHSNSTACDSLRMAHS